MTKETYIQEIRNYKHQALQLILSLETLIQLIQDNIIFSSLISHLEIMEKLLMDVLIFHRMFMVMLIIMKEYGQLFVKFIQILLEYLVVEVLAEI